MQRSNTRHGRTRSVFRIVWRAALCAAAVAFSLLAWFAAPASANHLGMYGDGSRAIVCSEHFPIAVFAAQGRYVILPTRSFPLADVIATRKQYEKQFGETKLPPPQVFIPLVNSKDEREALRVQFAASCTGLNLVIGVLTTPSQGGHWYEPRAHVNTHALGASTAVTVSRALLSTISALLALPFLCETYRAMKRRRWRRTGRCGDCGYPRTGLEKRRCPECGWTA